MPDPSQVAKKSILIPFITFIVGGLMGSGTLWSYLSHKIELENVKIVKIQTISDMRDKISGTLIELNNLHNKLNETLGKHEREFISEQLKLKADDLRVLETRLAEIENREPRFIRYDFVPPSIPANFKLR